MVYLSSGNRRMKIPTFSLLAEHTCPNATELCKKYCYAKKAERAYANAYMSRMTNTFDSFKATFVSVLSTEIRCKAPKYVRIHESGDFYNQEYLNKWFSICSKFPNTTFLAYTQMHNLNWGCKPKNMIVYWTVWPDSKVIPQGLKAYVIDNGRHKIPKYSNPKLVTGHHCKKGTKLTCDACLWCFEGKGDVIFKIH